MDPPIEDDPEPGMYKWLILFATFGLQLMASGIIYCGGVFYVIFKQHLQGSSTTIAFGNSLNMFFIFALGPLSGALSNKFGCRPVALIGSFIGTFGLILTSFINNSWQLCLTFGVLSGVGAGLVYIPSISAVSQYFTKRRPLAIGIAVAGIGAGGIVFTPILHGALLQYGWRGSIQIVAGLFMQSVVFSALLRPVEKVKNPDEYQEIQPSKDEDQSKEEFSSGARVDKPCISTRFGNFIGLFLLKNIKFDFYLMQSMLFSFGSSILVVHTAAFAIQQGYSQFQATMLYLDFGVSQTISRVLYGLLVQMTSVKIIRLYAISVLIVSIGTVLIPLTTVSYALMCAAITIGGICYASFGALPPLITAQLVGDNNLAVGYGYIGIICAIGFLAGAPFAAWLYAYTGYYPAVFYLASAVMFLSNFLLMPVLCHSSCADRRSYDQMQ